MLLAYSISLNLTLNFHPKPNLHPNVNQVPGIHADCSGAFGHSECIQFEMWGTVYKWNCFYNKFLDAIFQSSIRTKMQEKGFGGYNLPPLPAI